tara:strand:+ start:44 stop:505 length:462 start_codon:yes stop_codon:yes gene_type:complete
MFTDHEVNVERLDKYISTLYWADINIQSVQFSEKRVVEEDEMMYYEVPGDERPSFAQVVDQDLYRPHDFMDAEQHHLEDIDVSELNLNEEKAPHKPKFPKFKALKGRAEGRSFGPSWTTKVREYGLVVCYLEGYSSVLLLPCSILSSYSIIAI